jgi:hypothetical protein
MGGRANSVRPRRCGAKRRGGNCPASGHSWTGAECRKGLGWMEAEWPVFAVRSGQLERYFRRQGQATKGRRGERATPGVWTATNDVFWIARYVVQSGPHTRAAGIPCQSAAAIRPQGYCIRPSLDLLCHLTRLSEKKMLPSHREQSSTIPIRQTTLTTTIRMKIWTFDFRKYKSPGKVSRRIKYQTYRILTLYLVLYFYVTNSKNHIDLDMQRVKQWNKKGPVRLYLGL